MSFPSGMTLLLEGTSSYLDRHEYGQREQNTMDRGHLLPETLETPQSADIRPRRGFGLAPWHGRTSQESLLSVSSSVRRLLMGKAPAATPYEEQPYADGGRTIHERGNDQPYELHEILVLTNLQWRYLNLDSLRFSHL